MRTSLLLLLGCMATWFMLSEGRLHRYPVGGGGQRHLPRHLPYFCRLYQHRSWADWANGFYQPIVVDDETMACMAPLRRFPLCLPYRMKSWRLGPACCSAYQSLGVKCYNLTFATAHDDQLGALVKDFCKIHFDASPIPSPAPNYIA